MNIDYGDFWHVGEYTNPWHQIVNKKMKLFVDYNGTSGLYGLVTGFFQNVVLDGTALSYHSAVSLVRIFWALIIGSSCYFLVKDFALILPFFNYTIYPNRDRSVALLALLLILLLPKLIKNRIRWVQIYLIFSLFLFFYYPLNGVAFALGLFPFAIVQLYVTYKRNIWRKEMKSFTFWGLNIILLGSLIFLYKFIIGMLKNVFLLSSQTMLADGIAVYNYSIPSYWFLKFLKDDTLRKNMWYIYVCLVTLSVILIFWYLIYYYFQKYKGKSLISKLDSPIFLILFSSSIIIPINYTFTFIRMERNIEFSRTTGTMVIALGFLLNILLYRYGKKLFSNNLKIIFIGLTLGFVSLINGDSRGSEVDVLKKNYEVSKNFVYVNGKEIGLPKLGKGFIEKKDLSSLKIIKENVDKLVSDKENFWPSSRRELLYILDKKVPVKIDSMKLTKSLKASKENIKMLEKNPPAVILDLMNYESYYTYRWILDYGYVMYVDRGETFWVRPDIYEKKLGNLLEARKNTLDKFSSQEIEKIPYSLGNSIKTLSGIFSQKKEINTKDLKLEYNQINNIGKNKFSISNKKDPFFIVDLPENISGKDFDFMLIDLSSNYSEEKLKKLKIQFFLETTELPFYENRTLRFDYGNGKLLVPVGIHPAWLYSNMTRVRVDFENSVPGMEFRINKIEFLKLNLDRKE